MPVAMMLAGVEYEPHLLRQAIEQSGWGLIDTAVTSGRLISESVTDTMRRADAVIAVVSGYREISRETLVEIGMAIGMGKPVTVLWDEGGPAPRGVPAEIRTARLNVNNLDALRFHVRLFLAGVASWGTNQRVPSQERRPIGTPELSRLSYQLQLVQRRSLDGESFLSWIESLFTAAGATPVLGEREWDRGFDLVVGALPGAKVNAPILVEAKTRASAASLHSMSSRLQATVARERAALGVIIVLELRNRTGMELAGDGRVVLFEASELLTQLDAGASLAEILFSSDVMESRL